MKPHPRIRKTIKWGGLALTVLLVGVWVGSGWWYASWVRPTWNVQVLHGRAMYRVAGPLSTRLVPHFVCERSAASAGLDWWFAHSGSQYSEVWFVPLWIVIVPTAAVAFLLWYRDFAAARRARQNLCPTCRYPRTGLAPNAPCPECGSAPAHTSP